MNLNGAWSYLPLVLLMIAAGRQLLRGAPAEPPRSDEPHVRGPPKRQVVFQMHREDAVGLIVLFGCALFGLIVFIVDIIAKHWPVPR